MGSRPIGDRVAYMNVPLFALVVAAAWATTMLGIRRNYKRMPDVDHEAPLEGDHPSVLAVVPARNEETNLALCLEALSASDYPRLRIHVVNDGSTDRTAEIARSAAARDPRMTTTSIAELPPGWLGKNYALWRGTAGRMEDWFLFLDADVRVSASCISRAIAAAERTRADLFTMVTRVETLGFWEIAVQTVIAHLLALLFDPVKVNSPAYPRAVGACGPFMLFRRAAYESLGGHAAVRAEIVEDLRLAEAVKAAGLRLVVARGIGIASLRMYDSLSAIVRGWSKNAFIKRTKSNEIATPPWGVPLSAAGVLAFYWLPWALLLGSLVHGSVWSAGASAGALAMVVVAQLDFARLFRIDSRWPWLAPLGAAVTCWILMSAALRVARGKPAEWKGRAVA
jgi:cellulose synthase/poly-beta-1,6-N-acetylglucosamine synthase-like glycosyltransferase